MDLTQTILEKDRDIRGWSGWQNLSEAAVANLMAAHAIHIPLAMIENDVLRAYATYVLAHSHPRFWVCPSSSSGKHHPPQHNQVSEIMPGLEVGGLISHTWHVMAFAFDSMRRYGYNGKLSRKELDAWARTRDCLAFACILHDWAKGGDPTKGQWGSYVPDHGELAADIIEGKMLFRFLISFPEIRGDAETDLRGLVLLAAGAIRHHMGIWSRDKLKPSSPELSDLERMIQDGDMWCSRNCIKAFDDKVVVETLRSMSPSELSGCQTTVVSQAVPDAPAAEPEPTKSTEDFIW